jgi:hypothetical protein
MATYGGIQAGLRQRISLGVGAKHLIRKRSPDLLFHGVVTAFSVYPELVGDSPAGNMPLMPGLSATPQAFRMDVDEKGGSSGWCEGATGQAEGI